MRAWADVEVEVGVRPPRREARPAPNVADSGEAVGEEALGELRVTKRV